MKQKASITSMLPAAIRVVELEKENKELKQELRRVQSRDLAWGRDVARLIAQLQKAMSSYNERW